MFDLIDNEFDLSDMLFQYQNIGTVTTNGFEMELNASLSSDFNAFVNYSYQKSTDQNDQELSSSPEHLLKVGITAPIIYPINFSSEVHFEAERYSIYRKLSEPVLYGTFNLLQTQFLEVFKFLSRKKFI
jgi:outer membrane receptor protein involved in Fe transport